VPGYKQRDQRDAFAHLASAQSRKYLLRPELVESLFYLFRATGDERYREWGYLIFKAIERHCRTPAAFSGVNDVEKNPHTTEQIAANWNDSMQSFFFAETLKYLYLLFAPVERFDLAKRVFTTEAHTLGILHPDVYEAMLQFQD
jgi:hypothetical protein